MLSRVLTQSALDFAARTSFSPAAAERLFVSAELLNAFSEFPILSKGLALKGGAAAHLFCMPLMSRIPGDLDFNYVGSSERSVMTNDRSSIEEGLSCACRKIKLDIVRIPPALEGGKWILAYDSGVSGRETLSLDINFVMRVPLWPCRILSNRYFAVSQQVVDLHELLAGKLVAACGRSKARDLYDVSRLFEESIADPQRLRVAFVVLGAMQRSDWRFVDAARFVWAPEELSISVRSTELSRVGFSERIIDGVSLALNSVLPLSPSELEFLDRLIDHGELRTSLLTDDEELANRLRLHPGLRWKASRSRFRELL